MRDPFLALGDTSQFAKIVSFGEIADSGIVRGVGEVANIAGPFISGLKTVDHVLLQDKSFDTEGKLLAGKTVVDSGFFILKIRIITAVA